MNPFFKSLAFASLLIFLFSGKLLVSMFALLLMSVIVLIFTNPTRDDIGKPLMITSIYIILFLLIIRCLRFSNGSFVFLTENVSIALLYWSKITSFFYFIIAVTRWISIEEIFTMMSRSKLPRAFIFIMMGILNLLPIARRRAKEIIEAQRARGLLYSKFNEKLKAYPSLVIPLLISLFTDLENQTLSAISRGVLLNKTITPHYKMSFDTYDVVFANFCWIISLALAIIV